ncbi:hypothetical protein H5410_064796, partial [Solanum commersonii]
ITIVVFYVAIFRAKVVLTRYRVVQHREIGRNGLAGKVSGLLDLVDGDEFRVRGPQVELKNCASPNRLFYHGVPIL